MFSSLLVANRGEIACRIFRTARRMGIRTIAVYSSADRHALHVREADEAHFIGPAEARTSYLNLAQVLEAAKAARAEAIHPGYGFLSENAVFAEACANAGLIFVGPPPAAMRAMGLKDQAKAIAVKAGVPVVPGFQSEDQSERTLETQANKVGFPLIIKAVAGGGGKGMRIVDRAGDFREGLHACQREAKAAFGDDRVLLERFFSASRHIEVQVMADKFGQVVHLLERDCSIQRRHQKVIEEAPASGLSETTRERMQTASVAIAREVAYVGAGTIEFLCDPASDAFFFMEMNTRLQVEHPVSEMILGLDFVELQLKVAAGERLPFDQCDIKPSGHSMEARLYAEDPIQGFLPQTGRLLRLRWPEPEADLRVETGVEEGSRITAFYDPMIAKVIAHGKDRGAAMGRLARALADTEIFGLKTNKGFLERLLNRKELAGRAPTTRFIDELGAEALTPPRLLTIFGILAWLLREAKRTANPWTNWRGWTFYGLPQGQAFKLTVQGIPADVRVQYSDTDIIVRFNGQDFLVSSFTANGEKLSALINGETIQGKTYYGSGSNAVYADLEGYQITIGEPDYTDVRASISPSSGLIRAPMPGRVVKINVGEGMSVESGQMLLVLEAMKMEHILKSPLKGVAKRIDVREGDQVKEGDYLCLIEPENAVSS